MRRTLSIKILHREIARPMVLFGHITNAGRVLFLPNPFSFNYGKGSSG